MVKLKKIIDIFSFQVPSKVPPYSDIQSDMARHDEEGSGRIMPDDVDDEEYPLAHGSGDGSGDGNFALINMFLWRSLNV